MILCVAGDTHGQLDRMYHDVLAFEAALGVTFDHLLHVGDFGIWPDASKLDRATRNHDGAGDFAAWQHARRPVPRPTLFIKGNHEDFDCLQQHRFRELLPGLRWLPNGERANLGEVTVGGIGGCYSAADYGAAGRKLLGKQRSHYTKDELAQLCLTKVDILLLHDAPIGVQFSNYAANAAGLAEAIARIRPKLVFFGHHHQSVRAEVAGLPCIGLNLIGRPGHLAAVQIGPAGFVQMGLFP